MKTILRVEELAKLGLAYLVSLFIGYAPWVFWSLLLAPDVSLVGYLVNPKVGAWVYNVFHHQAVAIAVGVCGWYLHVPELQLAGAILFGHSAMDRALGFGLKFEDSFKHTHLGGIGKVDDKR